jgi:N-acetylneuraminic acid mutarotase
MKTNLKFCPPPVVKMLSMLIMALIMVCMPNIAFADKWEQKADMPTGRVGLSVAEANRKIYAIGGLTPSGVSSIVEEYDPLLDKWTKKADMPATLFYHASTTANGKIYVIGGFPNVSTVFEYDPLSDTWKTKSPMPSPKCCFTAYNIGGKIFALGGYSDGNNLTASLSVCTYDPELDQWAKLDDIPDAFSMVESTSACVGDKIYFFGGFTKNLREHTRVFVFDVQNLKWKMLDAKTIRRSFGVAGNINDKIYVIAGEDPFQAWKGLSNVEEYDIATDTIINKTEIPHRRG